MPELMQVNASLVNVRFLTLLYMMTFAGLGSQGVTTLGTQYNAQQNDHDRRRDLATEGYKPVAFRLDIVI